MRKRKRKRRYAPENLERRLPLDGTTGACVDMGDASSPDPPPDPPDIPPIGDDAPVPDDPGDPDPPPDDLAPPDSPGQFPYIPLPSAPVGPAGPA